MDITPGTPLIYSGSIQRLWGDGTYVGPCTCGECRFFAGLARRRGEEPEVEYHRILTAGGPVRHVRPTSFELDTTP